MPTYQVYVKEGQFNAAQKKQLANTISNGHSEATGAPKYFVQVVFHEVANENRYVNGEEFNDFIWIQGNVRKRSSEGNKNLGLTLVNNISDECNIEKYLIRCYLHNLDHNSVIEFEGTMPPVGEEKTWEANLPKRIKDFISSIKTNTTKGQ